MVTEIRFVDRVLTLEALEDRCLPSFLAAVPYATGDYLAFVVTEDFNQDGNLDLAIARAGIFANDDGDVRILLGNGDGTFGDANMFKANNRPNSLASGDFDENGCLDLAVVNRVSNDVSVLKGNCDGSFGSPVNHPVGQHPVGVAVADFDNDNIEDLAVTNSDDDSVSILKGSGTGSFTLHLTFDTRGSIPGFLVADDFDSDGNKDLAVTLHTSGDVSIYRGTGNGSFSFVKMHAVGKEPNLLAAGDFNHDGLTDLAVACYKSPLTVLQGMGDGSFSVIGKYRARSATGVAISDFNLDGNQDLAVSNNGNNTAGVFLGPGTGAFLPPSHYPVGAAPTSIASGDFNGDGYPDLAVTNGNDMKINGISILINAADWAPIPIPLGRETAKAATLSPTSAAAPPTARPTGDAHSAVWPGRALPVSTSFFETRQNRRDLDPVSSNMMLWEVPAQEWN